jgi:predicted nucleic acid-binding protein
MRIALDSNVMIYAEGLSEGAKRFKALEVLDAIPALDLLIPFQAVGETLRWLVHKGGIPKDTATKRIARWTAKYPTQATDAQVFQGALELVSQHGFQIWDAVVCAAAAEGGASVLLSEDMHQGFKWRGVIIINPFALEPHALFTEILKRRH